MIPEIHRRGQFNFGIVYVRWSTEFCVFVTGYYAVSQQVFLSDYFEHRSTC